MASNGFGNSNLEHSKRIATKNKSEMRAFKACQKFNTLKAQIHQLGNTNIELNFKSTKYSKNGKYRFPYSVSNAETIFNSCTYANDTFSLLNDNFFTGKLNIFKYCEEFQEQNPERILNISEQAQFEDSDCAKSNLTEDEYFDMLEISTWSYTNLITSATYFYFETISSQLATQTPSTTKQQSTELKIAAGKLGSIVLSPVFGTSVFKSLKKTNLFQKFTYEFVYGFASFLESQILESNGTVHNCNKLITTINNRFQGNFNRFVYYLSAFDFIIPRDIITDCSKYCIKTQSITVIYSILKQYRNVLNPSLSPEEKSYANYCISKCFFEEFNSIIKSNSSKRKNILTPAFIYSSTPNAPSAPPLPAELYAERYPVAPTNPVIDPGTAAQDTGPAAQDPGPVSSPPC